MATTVGSIQLLATIDTSRYKQGAKEIEKTNADVEKSGDRASSNLNKGFSNVAKVGLAALTAAAVAAGAAIVSNIGNAIRRVDTLNNANRTFENMGFETLQVEKSMDRLVDSITGLPTPLDSAVRGMQSLAATYSDVSQGQRVFTALNNAILGFGGTAAEVDNAIQQLSQLPMDGPLDAQTWNSLRNSGLTPVLVAMAKEMGVSINEMKEDFGEGELTVRDFTQALVRMNEEGGGGLKSLEQIAKDATSGIGTGWANMQTAITRGIATIIKAIGSEDISRAITSIGNAFETALESIAGSIAWIDRYGEAIKQVAVVIGTLLIPAMIRFVALQVVAGTQALITGARIAAGWLLALGPIGLIIAAVGAAVALIVMNWDTIKEVASTVFKAISDFAGRAVDSIAKVWGNIADFFEGIWGGVIKVFNAVVGFFKKWGLAILAVVFLPFAIVIGLIFKFREQIMAVFNAIARGIMAVVAPVVGFLVTVFTTAFNVIVSAITAAWNVITTVFGAIGSWFASRWQEVVTVFSAVASFFGGVFRAAWDTIVTVFSPLFNFFKGIWDRVVGLFRTVGTTVGNAIGDAFKSVINIVLNGAVRVINFFIDGINSVIGVINNIPGVNIGNVGKLGIPQLADGGIVTGPTLAEIGEGGEAEAVIPLSKLDDMLGSNRGNGRNPVIQQTNNVYTELDMNIVNRRLTWELNRA